jgi:hypothetical protein
MNYNILEVTIKILDNRFILINSSNTVMADQPFMYAIVIGVFAAFAAVLFTARAKRYSKGFRPATEETKIEHS